MKSDGYLGVVVVVGSMVVLAGLNCRPNNDPVIQSVEGPDYVEIGTSARYVCHASDPDTDELHYRWSCNRGSLAGTDDSLVDWTAPALSCSAEIVVQASDGRAGDVVTKPITVYPHTFHLLDDVITVDAHRWSAWLFNVDSSLSRVYVEGNFTASGGTDNSIKVHIMDDFNYQHWTHGDLVMTCYSSGLRNSASIYANLLPSRGPFHVVYDNLNDYFYDRTVQTDVDVRYEP